jgi:hypothetical protein
LHSLRFTPLAGCSTVLAGEVAEHRLKRTLVDSRIKYSVKEEHLLSWPFLGETPEVTRIGNHCTTDFMCHVQQAFVARNEYIRLDSLWEAIPHWSSSSRAGIEDRDFGWG